MAATLIDPEAIPTLDEIDFNGLEATVRSLHEAAGHLRRHGEEIDGGWATGIALHYLAPNGQALAEKMMPVKQHAGRVAEAGDSTADALRGYVDEGAPLKSALLALKRDAAAFVAKAQGFGAGWQDKPDLVEENEHLKSQVNEKVAAHEEARERTARAIDATNNGPDATAAEQVGGYLSLLSVPLFGLGAYTAEMTLHRFGRFQPSGAGSRFISVKNATPWQNTWRRMWSRNWIAKPYAATTRATWLTVGKWGGRAGGLVAAGTAGLNQWDKDSQDPTMPTEKRVARTGVKAVVTGGGAMAGAQSGAAVGGAVGAMFGGVGAPVGAVVGGVIGAAAGAGVGSWTADKFNDLIGK